MTTKHSDKPSTPPEEPYTRQILRDESASVAVVRTIAALKNAPVDEIDPLVEWLDPDALDEIVAHGDGVTVEFEYVDLSVTVDRRSVTVLDAAEK